MSRESSVARDPSSCVSGSAYYWVIGGASRTTALLRYCHQAIKRGYCIPSFIEFAELCVSVGVGSGEVHVGTYRRMLFLLEEATDGECSWCIRRLPVGRVGEIFFLLLLGCSWFGGVRWWFLASSLFDVNRHGPGRCRRDRVERGTFYLILMATSQRTIVDPLRLDVTSSSSPGRIVCAKSRGRLQNPRGTGATARNVDFFNSTWRSRLAHTTPDYFLPLPNLLFPCTSQSVFWRNPSLLSNGFVIALLPFAPLAELLYRAVFDEFAAHWYPLYVVSCINNVCK